ncbi:MAG: ABC transporter ATP-binding protein [Anaerosomatales bacterium]|nr:ABC transporter ATP-binding protein [Anaerosomatales bacterium]MDT8433788.1 ABC transporter ATP-binding protein [Anaerosomatales bacterium]
MSAISVRDVEQLFHLGTRSVVHALRGTILEVAAGEFVAVMGPSGSGKTTLLNVIGCLARPTAGHIEIDGEDVTKLGDRALDRIRAGRVGFVFQGYSLIPTRTALENVMMAAEYAGLPRAERRERAVEMLERVGLADQAGQPASELSGGEQQRVAIARALVKGPRIVLADEPTGNLDSVSAEEIMVLIKELRADGQTIVMVTHDPRMAGYADRIVFLKDGRVVDETALR